MTPFSFGDVVLVKFPFTNLQTTKQRPAVIISSREYQENRPDVIIMAITSRIHEPLLTGEAKIGEWKASGLLKPSVFKPLIATVEKEQIIKVLGKISQSDGLRLTEIIRAIIGSS
jgi:mRNA interferase MazF